MKKIGLLPKLIIGIAVGIGLGLVAQKNGADWLVRLMITFSGIVGNFMQFVVPLIILGFVAPGIGDLGKSAGKLLGITVAIAYGSTLVSGTVAFLTNKITLPIFLKNAVSLANTANPEDALLKPFFTIDMPPVMGVMTALIMAFIVGICIAVVETDGLKKVFHELQFIVEKIIGNIIIPVLPFYVACVFANMAFAGRIVEIMSVFIKVFATIIVLHWLIIFVQYVVAGTLAGGNPLKLVKNMLPAYATAIGTQSSAATIPVTLQSTKNNGVAAKIADFVVPLCATIHLSGSTITLTSCAMAVMMLNGMPIAFGKMFGFIMMLGVMMVAAPGIPGGAVMAALGLLQSNLGFSQDLCALMIALYLAQDSFGTACNVTGDGAIAVMVNKIAGNKLEKNSQ